MKKSIFINVLAAVMAVLTVPSFADNKATYIGSSCSFADNPLASHNKIHHRFQNMSGEAQWVTCPIVRDEVYKNIELILLDTVGGISYARLEQRGMGNGSLTGWNADGARNLGGGGLQHYWFNGDASGSAENAAALALEIRLNHNAYISMYEITENN